MNNKINILCIGANTRLERSRRSYQLMHHLAQRHEINKVLYVEAPLAIWFVLGAIKARNRRRDLILRLRHWWSGVQQSHDNQKLYLYLPLMLLPYHQFSVDLSPIWNDWIPVDLLRLRKLSNSLLWSVLRRIVDGLGMGAPLVIWLYAPLALSIIDYIQGDLVCYDCHDDILSRYPGVSDVMKREVRRAGSWLMQEADIVFAASEYFVKAMSGTSRTVHLLPDAVDLEHFQQPASVYDRVSDAIQSIEQPIIGYVGTIDDRLDWELVEGMALSRPDWSFVFVGPVQRRHLPSDVQALRNVHYLGEQPYDYVPAFISAFSVAIMPHRITRAVQLMDPLKLYEYLAVGKPVVSTPVAGTERFREVIRIADEEKDFLRHIESCLVEAFDRGKSEQRKRAVRTHTWQHRAQTVINVLYEALAI